MIDDGQRDVMKKRRIRKRRPTKVETRAYKESDRETIIWLIHG